MSRFFIAAFAVLTLLQLPAAFGSDVCSKVTEAEIAAAVGTQLQRSPSDPCRFGKGTQSVAIKMHPGAASQWDTYASGARQEFSDAQPVQGVGSQAIFFGFSLGVQYKSDIIVIQMMLGKTKPEKLAFAKAVALKVISHL